MTSLQKVIKYGAMAFGFYLAFVILSAIVFGVISVFGIFVGIDAYKTYTTKEEVVMTSFEEVYENVNDLDIKLDVSKLSIKIGNEFKVQVNNPTNGFYCKMDGDSLKIRDQRNNINIFDFSDEVIPEIIIYIPDGKKLNDVELKAGVSETYIEKLNTNEANIETGVGKFIIADIEADIANISGGAGEVSVENSVINELKLEAGVGKFVINSEIKEEAKLEAGVGQLIVNLKGNKEDYKVKTNTGIGNVLVNNQKVGDNQIVGAGNRYIKVEAGVGEVKINFSEDNI